MHATAAHVGGDGAFLPAPQPGFVAYRTVPVTRDNLHAGALVMSVRGSLAVPDREIGLDTIWEVGTVASIDWDEGKLRRDGQPSAADAAPLSDVEEDCGARRDHCLRPWVWFVDQPRGAAPARWTGTQLVSADDGTPVYRPGVAYRTRAATAAELTPGLRVLVYEEGRVPSDQLAAHQPRHWRIVEVGAVERDGFVERGSDRRYALESTRVLVVYWIAGEAASKVE